MLSRSRQQKWVSNTDLWDYIYHRTVSDANLNGLPDPTPTATL